MPPPISKLAPGLQRVWEATQGFYADALPQLKRVGEVFRELAERPGYFATGKELPTGRSDKEAAQFLSRKHGVLLETDGNGLLQAGRNIDMMELPYRAGHFDNLARHVKEGRLRSDAPLWEIDSLPAEAGTGQAKSAYPALYEFILSRPDAANMPQSLSPSNAWRRSANMVGLLEKHGQPAANRLLIDDYQLAPLGERSRAVPYHRLPLGAQIGLLNSLTSARAGSVVDQVTKGVFSRAEHPTWAAENPQKAGALRGLMERAGRLGLDPRSNWEPSTDVGPEYFDELSEFLRSAAPLTENTQAVGKDSLRRAAITHDAFTQGLRAQDLATQPYLSERLGRRAGGSVPGRTPGGLAQTCSCADR